MCGCCRRAVTSISRLKRSTLTPAARSGDSTLTTTRRPSASSSARNTRLIPPPPSSRSRRYAPLRVVSSRSRRSVSKPATFATSEADSKPPGPQRGAAGDQPPTAPPPSRRRLDRIGSRPCRRLPFARRLRRRLALGPERPENVTDAGPGTHQLGVVAEPIADQPIEQPYLLADLDENRFEIGARPYVVAPARARRLEGLLELRERRGEIVDELRRHPAAHEQVFL